jgi:hypothetical protein
MFIEVIKRLITGILSIFLYILFVKWQPQKKKNVIRFMTDRYTQDWISQGFVVPAPKLVKQFLLRDYSIVGSDWIETGTHTGEMSAYLSSFANKVITIEPSSYFYELATTNLQKIDNVEILFGTSETNIESACKEVTGHVALWLDGHYSGGETFKGDSECPVPFELAIIEKYLSTWVSTTIFIDDFREFKTHHTNYSDYPSNTFLTNWATSNRLNWTVENDIFIASSNPLVRNSKKLQAH